MSYFRMPLCCLLLLVVLAPQAFAASEKASAQRKANDLIPYTPPDKFLNGNFIADEMAPAYVFGTVKAFAASRACPVTWLIEENERSRMDKPANPAVPAEFTLYLEEDCPDKVVYYVFIDQSAMTPKQWIDWRQQFHKSKAEKEYTAAVALLDKAVADGVAVAGELRFIQKDGELQAKHPEEVLKVECKFPPLYDLKQGKKLTP